MSNFKLLIAEDDESDINACRSTVERYIHEKMRNIELVESRNVDDALTKIDNTFDGAIIDLKLVAQGNEGNQVLKKIKESRFRIPVAVLTGTPSATDSEFTYIGVFTKGESGSGYSDILDIFWGIYNTGLTRIMGGRGKIEETLNTVFTKNLLSQQKKWVAYGESDPVKTEKALLRHTLSHLQQLLDNDEDRFFPEEVYISPPLTDNVRTGSIVKDKSGEKQYMVMNPACDLVIREEGSFNTDRILLVEIDLRQTVFPGFPTTGLSRKQQGELESAFNNKKSTYYHWLPMTGFFVGGFLNFRKMTTFTKDDFQQRFDKPKVQVSSSFVKDIVARFSSYYARQGQPDINYDEFIVSNTAQPGQP